MQRASNSLNESPEGRLLALRFGPFELDVRSGELRRNGTTVRLQPQPLKVLLLLAGPPGRGGDARGDPGRDLARRHLRRLRAVAQLLHPPDPRRAAATTRTRRATSRRCRAAATAGWPAPCSRRRRPPWCASGRGRSPWSRRRAARLVEATLRRDARGRGARPSSARWRAGGPRRARPAGARRRWPRSRSRQQPAAPQASPTFQRITFRRGAVNSARFGPDGQVVYSAAWDGGGARLYVARSDPRDSSTLEIKDAQVVGVSAAGEVAFLRAGVLARAPLAGGPAKDMLKRRRAPPTGAPTAATSRWRAGEGRAVRIEFPVGPRPDRRPPRASAGCGSRPTGATSPSPSTRC